MKTEREARIAQEQSSHSAENLSLPMYDIGEDAISDLAREAGCASSKAFLNESEGWSASLKDTIEYLVNCIYTLDGVTYETKAELQKAAL